MDILEEPPVVYLSGDIVDNTELIYINLKTSRKICFYGYDDRSLKILFVCLFDGVERHFHLVADKLYHIILYTSP